ncbi:PAC2 family-domain-containing protein [Dunaliella salina]|uniref:Proteasome assembly chaperone 2 n=1 Tax=Dunaliella salina TaxID=3046 RepID=A0ABQ7H7K7_DUNSA|nr:PAC2 family-domain-containing protein [Dunaliella salina]|eukprot:KAF5842841.1 PAC2 family-domain-containing protein [Dunaliella salina]
MQAFSVEKGLNLQEATVVLPAVSVGNVGELATDVLITSLLPAGLHLVARLEEPNCLPVVGNDAYSLQAPGTLSTALELYHLQGTTTYFLQQRAPAMKGRQAEFAASLAHWLQREGVQQVVVLCGLNAVSRKDSQIMGAPTRFLSSAGSPLSELCASGLGLPVLEEDYLAEEKQLHGLLPPWPLLEACQQRAIPTLLLMRFVTEGDNQADGMELARQTLSFLLLHAPSGVREQLGKGSSSDASSIQLQLRAPCSWAALYGRSSGGIGLVG